MERISLYEMTPEIYDEYMSSGIEDRNFQAVFQKIQGAVEPESNIRVLDLCCGTAIFWRNWLGKLCNVSYVGVDVNKSFLEFAAKHCNSERCSFVESDAVEVDLREDFDVVLATSSYHHIVDEKKISFLKNLKRHLKKDGTGIIYEKLVAPFSDGVGSVRSGSSFYVERIVDMLKSEKLSELQLFALFNELYLTSVRREEYKVSFEKLAGDLKDAGFKVDSEEKLWPLDNRFANSQVGDFVLTFKRLQ